MLSHREVAKAEGIAAVPNELADGYECSLCAQHFCTRQALAVHSSKKHRVLRIAREYVRDSACPTCLRKFANRSRLVDHLSEKSGVCLMNVLLTLPRLEQEHIDELNEADKALEQSNRAKLVRHTFSSVKAVQLQGPLRQLVISLNHSRQSRYPAFIAALATAVEVDYGA